MGTDNTVARWAVADVNFLSAHYGKIPLRDIASALHRTESSTQSKARALGLKAPRISKRPVSQVKTLKASGKTMAEIAQQLNLTKNQVNSCLYHTGTKDGIYTPKSRARWTQERVNKLTRLIAEQTPVHLIAEKLGLTEAAIRVKASTLKLKLSRLKRGYSQKDIDLAYQMKEAGFTVRLISMKLDDPPISPHTVRRILSNESPSWELI